MRTVNKRKERNAWTLEETLYDLHNNFYYSLKFMTGRVNQTCYIGQLRRQKYCQKVQFFIQKKK